MLAFLISRVHRAATTHTKNDKTSTAFAWAVFVNKIKLLARSQSLFRGLPRAVFGPQCLGPLPRRLGTVPNHHGCCMPAPGATLISLYRALAAGFSHGVRHHQLLGFLALQVRERDARHDAVVVKVADVAGREGRVCKHRAA